MKFYCSVQLLAIKLYCIVQLPLYVSGINLPYTPSHSLRLVSESFLDVPGSQGL